VANLAIIQAIPRTREEIAAWSFSHAVHHVDLNRRIYEVHGQNLTNYFLDNFDPDNPGMWMYLHQSTHLQMDQVLGINPYDLNTLDWQNPDSVSTWFEQHYGEHQQAATILNV
jgi:hypothetical protein